MQRGKRAPMARCPTECALGELFAPTRGRTHRVTCEGAHQLCCTGLRLAREFISTLQNISRCSRSATQWIQGYLAKELFIKLPRTEVPHTLPIPVIFICIPHPRLQEIIQSRIDSIPSFLPSKRCENEEEYVPKLMYFLKIPKSNIVGTLQKATAR